MMKPANRLSPSCCMVKDASCISVTVILKRFNNKKLSLSYKSKLRQQVHDILVNSEVVPGSEIDLEHSKLAVAYGVTNIEVLKCKTSENEDSAEACRVMHKTGIDIEAVRSVDFSRLKSAVDCVWLGGLDKELQELKFLLTYGKMAGLPRTFRTAGVLLHGPPGCGKTSLCRALSHACEAALITVETTDLLKPEFGSGAEILAEMFARAKSLSSEGSVILFLDELDTLCPHPTFSNPGNHHLTSALVIEMDRLRLHPVPGVLVVAATNALTSVDPPLRRPGRFDREILLNVPSRKQRLDILKVKTGELTQTTDISLAADVSLAEIADMTAGYVGADLQALCQETLNIAHTQAPQADQQSDSPNVRMSDFSAALHKVSPSLKKGLSCHVELQPVYWDDIGGLDDVKAEIRQSIEWPLLHPEALKKMDLAATKGVLLYGPPGCCKTTLVRAAATSCNITFLALSGAQVYSPYVGESERIVSEAFQKARALAPAILFFDEIDSLVGKRSTTGGQSRVQERILATMLNEMDGIGTRLDLKTTASNCSDGLHEKVISDAKKETDCATSTKGHGDGASSKTSDIDLSRVVVIGATNRLDMLDPAILRPGRLDRHIHVPPPDREGRKSILSLLVSKMATAEEVDLDHISDHTEFFSGADLKNLCREAALTAIRCNSIQAELNTSGLVVGQEHFTTALKRLKPSLSPQILLQYS